MLNAGYTNSVPVLDYDSFVNYIYIGALNDFSP